MSGPTLFLQGLGLAASMMASVFLFALRIRNFSIVDIAWSAAFTPLALLYAARGEGYEARRALIAAMVTLWSLRLAGHLYRRIAALHPEEEGRYVQLRQEWAANLRTRFFLFFQVQGLLAALLSVPFLLSCTDRRPALGPFEVAGAALFIIALVGEAVADRQLAAFKADPRTRGRTCQAGLWRYSRHPNYFFEWLVWTAYWVFAWPSPGGWLAISARSLMLFLLFRVTGIPLTEQQAVRVAGRRLSRLPAHHERVRSLVPEGMTCLDERLARSVRLRARRRDPRRHPSPAAPAAPRGEPRGPTRPGAPASRPTWRAAREPDRDRAAAANAQHYEVPADFFELVLGPPAQVLVRATGRRATDAWRGRGGDARADRRARASSPTARTSSNSAAAGAR